MDKRKFCLNDVMVIKDKDRLTDEMLSSIMGGNNLSISCTCKCDSGNCYEDYPPTDLETMDPFEPILV